MIYSLFIPIYFIPADQGITAFYLILWINDLFLIFHCLFYSWWLKNRCGLFYFFNEMNKNRCYLFLFIYTWTLILTSPQSCQNVWFSVCWEYWFMNLSLVLQVSSGLEWKIKQWVFVRNINRDGGGSIWKAHMNISERFVFNSCMSVVIRLCTQLTCQ